MWIKIKNWLVLRSLKQHIPIKHKVFIIGAVWVEPKSSAAGSRMLQLIQFFLSQGWEVAFGTTAKKNENSMNLKFLGVQEYCLELNDISFDELICNMNPTMVLFDRFLTEEQFGWRVAENCPGALRILDTEDLHCLRKTRQEAIKKGVHFELSQLFTSEIAKREIASIYRCDISLIISTYELRLLKENFKIDESLLCHLPFFLNPVDKETLNRLPSFEDRKDFVSIGNFLHAPNVDATLQLKREIWSRIRDILPKAALHIYGAYPTQQVRELHSKTKGFFVHGYVENAYEVISKSRVLLAPLRFGAGIKGKLTDAMQSGTPSVTTPIGAEGMHDSIPWNGFITDDWSEFVEKAVMLYSDSKVWHEAQQNGMKIVNQQYSKEYWEAQFLQRLDTLYKQLESRRNQNFIGQILQHHTLKSTKYLSKWIEAKKRK